MKIRILLLLALSVFVIGCAPRYPVTRVTTIDSRPTLSFVNAPAGAVVLVDNVEAGEASLYSGKPKVLAVEPGTHEIVVMQNGSEIFRQTVFVESEHKVINVH